jgi:hypothetical protein
MYRQPSIWGGQTAPRYAQTEGSAQGSNENRCVPWGTCDYDWTRQLGQLPVLPSELPDWPEEPPAWWPPEQPYPPSYEDPTLPPALPAPGGVLTEAQCAARESAAFSAGAREESGRVLKTAAVSAAVSVMVGAAVGYFLR